jgi:signal transduction histidine kinase
VHSNIGALENYIDDLFGVLDQYEAAEASISSPEQAAAITAKRKEVDVDFLKEDIPMLMRESREGITRVKKIVQDLKDFSHVDANLEWAWANLHTGIDSTLSVVTNEIKYKADVIKEYGNLPDVECLASQLNQVFMNLLVNAAHAMGEERGKITIRTGSAGDSVWLEFADTGSGMPEAVMARIFDPFFTTKPVGKGTGLGLSLSYGIIQKHNGSITVQSRPGEGTTFRIVLPIKHVEPECETSI